MGLKDDLASIVFHYYEVKGIHNEEMRKYEFGKWCKYSKVLLRYAHGDVDKVLKAITDAKDYFESRNLSWKMTAVVNNWDIFDNVIKRKEDLL